MIDTPRLQIVRFEARFISAEYVSWLNDREVVKYSDQRFARHTIESCTAYLQSFDGTPNYFWAILRKDRNLQHIGNINAYVNRLDGVADLGILIGERSATRKGFGQEAWQAVCRYLLTTAGMRKISAGTLSVNQGMLAIMKNCGMASDGIRKRHRLVDGEAVDVVHMALFAEQVPPPAAAESMRRPCA